MSVANYSSLIVAVLDDGFRRFGKPQTREEVSDMAMWVRCRVEDIKAGRPIDRPVRSRDQPDRDNAWTDLGGL